MFNFHFPWPFMDLLSLFVPKNKTIVTYHADITKRNILYYLYIPIMFLFLMRAKKIIVTSKDYLQSSKILKFFKEKVEIIPIGIKQKKNLKKISKKIKKYKNKKYFIFIGNLREYKGIEVLIRAFSKMNFYLLILGDGKKTELVKQHIRNNDNILLLKNINDEDKFFLIRHSQALILPSTDRREAYGIALVEGLSEGKPLISTKINSGSSYINKNNVTGFEIKPHSEVELIKVVKKISSSNKLKKRFEKAAKKRFDKFFTQEIMVRKYFRLFARI